jgi:Ca-activated chloride channel homolog
MDPHMLKTVIITLALASSCLSCSAISHSAGCTHDQLDVAVAPSLAGPVRSAAQRFNAHPPTISRHCVTVAVTSSDPAGVANVLSQPPVAGMTRPGAWIPDSSLWITQARATQSGAALVGASGPSLATTPLVIAASKRTAAALHQPLSWRSLVATGLPATGSAAAVRFRFLDPSSSAAGLGTLLLAHRAAGTGQAGLARFAMTLHTDAPVTVPTASAAVTAITDRTGPPTAVVMPEQAVRAEIKLGHPIKLLTSKDPSFNLDFPYVTTTADPVLEQAATRFRGTLQDQTSQQSIRLLGFRAPAGAGITLPAPKVVGEILQMWQRTVIGTRMLIMLDVSPSMGLTVPGTTSTRIQATAAVAAQGLRILSSNSAVGLWQFATALDGDLDYRVSEPIRPLSAKVGGSTQRDLLLGAFAAAKPAAGTHTGLYNSILAGFKAVTRGYEPNRNNILVVLTDGWNDDPGETMSLPGLVTALHKAADPDRPVAIVPIAFGPDVMQGPLQQIAGATGGQAFVTLDPRQIEQVFLNVLIRVTCGTSCPMS